MVKNPETESLRLQLFRRNPFGGRLNFRQHVLGMAGDFHLRPDPDDLAVRADQHRLADHAHEGAAVHRFLAPGAIGLEHRLVLVAGERDGEVVLVAEFVERADRIGRDPEHVGVELGEAGLEPREVHGFLGAAARVRLGIEIEDQIAALVVAERHLGAAVARKFERGGAAAHLRAILRVGRRYRSHKLSCAPSFRRFTPAICRRLRPGRGCRRHRRIGGGGR